MSTAASQVPLAPTSTAPLMFAEEFARRHGGDYMELVDGIVLELPMASAKHGRICLVTGRLIDEYAEKSDLGRVMSNDSFVQTKTSPDTTRGAGVSFYRYDRLPKG